MAEKQLVSLILLLSKPRELEENDLRSRFSHATGAPFTADLHSGDGVKQMKPGMFMVRVANRGFGLMSIAKPYWDVLPPDVQNLETRVRHALQNHTAWIAIDLLERSLPGGVMTPEEEQRGYRTIGKLLAELASEDVLALMNYSHRRCMYWHDASAESLRSDDPFAAFQPYTPIVYTKSPDAELEAAVEEARRRWPEFIHAYFVRQPKQAFAVKASFSEGQFTEIMWVEVSSIDGDTIQGFLRNEPNNFRLLKLNDRVEVRQSDVMDWMYDSGGAFRGGFMTQVFAQRASGGKS